MKDEHKATLNNLSFKVRMAEKFHSKKRPISLLAHHSLLSRGLEADGPSNVTADVDEKKANAKVIAERFVQETLPQIASEFPGIKYSLEGEQRERKESFASMARGGLIALVVIFGLLAIPFRSYTQPIIIMTAMPFGLVGAVIGHLVMGYSLSLISMFGLVALTGLP